MSTATAQAVETRPCAFEGCTGRTIWTDYCKKHRGQAKVEPKATTPKPKLTVKSNPKAKPVKGGKPKLTVVKDVEPAPAPIPHSATPIPIADSKITVATKALREALRIVGQSISTRTTLPILNNVLLTWTRDALILSTTNLEYGFNVQLAAKATAEGSLTLPHRIFKDLVDKIRALDVQLVVDAKTFSAKLVGEGETNIKGIEAEEYPPGPDFKDAVSYTFTSAILPAIKGVLHSASTDVSRPVLTGILLNLGQGELVTTDGHTLARRSIKAAIRKAPDLDGVRVILPGDAMKALMRSAKGGGDILFEYERNTDNVPATARFVSGDVTFVTRLIDGTYPNYSQVIPAEHALTIEVKRQPLLDAVTRVTLLARDSANVIRLNGDGEKLRLSAVTNEVGDSVEELRYKGGEFMVALNGRYVMRTLKAHDVETVRFGWTNPLAPVTFGAGDHIDVVMPVRVAN